MGFDNPSQMLRENLAICDRAYIMSSDEYVVALPTWARVLVEEGDKFTEDRIQSYVRKVVI